MRKNFKYRLYPTGAQGGALDHQLAEACRLYNAAVQERRDAYKIAGESINYYDQANQLKEIRAAGDLELANFSLSLPKILSSLILLAFSGMVGDSALLPTDFILRP